jgi:hypothetical protein
MGNARNRQRRPGRRPPFRDAKPTILVVCEGDVTESEYLRGFTSACRNPRVTVKVAPEHGVPRTLVETAKSYKRAAEKDARRERDVNLAYDSVWCVFDIDDHPNVGEVQEMARDNKIDLAISNPCFELWLLLHFRDNPGMQSRARMKNLLEGYVPGYDKHVAYADYSAAHEQATERARRMDDAAREAGERCRNPTTGVYRLTEVIRAE